jgi:hypothetical protein
MRARRPKPSARRRVPISEISRGNAWAPAGAAAQRSHPLAAAGAGAGAAGNADIGQSAVHVVLQVLRFGRIGDEDEAGVDLDFHFLFFLVISEWVNGKTFTRITHMQACFSYKECQDRE